MATSKATMPPKMTRPVTRSPRSVSCSQLVSPGLQSELEVPDGGGQYGLEGLEGEGLEGVPRRLRRKLLEMSILDRLCWLGSSSEPGQEKQNLARGVSCLLSG